MKRKNRNSRIMEEVLWVASQERILFWDFQRLFLGIKKKHFDKKNIDNIEISSLQVKAHVLLFTQTFIKRIIYLATASSRRIQLFLLQEESDVFYDAIDKSIVSWAQYYGQLAIGEIADTTQKKVNEVVQAGIETGLDNAEIAEEIGLLLDGQKANARAMLIARTETGIATASGANIAVKKIGMEVEKEWGATEDNRTRPTHRIADGQIVNMDELFVVGNALLEYCRDPKGPPEEIINCRCTTLYWPKGIPR